MQPIKIEARQYYNFWLRGRLLLIIGLGIGALVGSVYYYQRDQSTDFTVTGLLVMNNRYPPLEFKVVSRQYPKAYDAAESIVIIAGVLERKVDEPVKIQSLKMEHHNANPLWKRTVLGSVMGVLIVIGGMVLWGNVLIATGSGNRLR